MRFVSSPKLLEVSKHEWYHVVTNCLNHVFITSLFSQSSQKFDPVLEILFFFFALKTSTLGFFFKYQYGLEFKSLVTLLLTYVLLHKCNT